MMSTQQSTKDLRKRSAKPSWAPARQNRRAAGPRLLAASLLLGFLAASPHAEAVVVERVVAVVGEKAILLSDLRARARPHLLRVFAQIAPGPQRAAAESRVLSQVIERIVDEELEANVASRQNTRVTAQETDKALQRVARLRSKTLPQLFETVEADTGLTEIEYRQEIRRQVLEGKLLGRFAANQRVSDEELVKMLKRLRQQERMYLVYRPAWIVLALGKTPKPELVKTRMAAAKDLVARARAGADFGSLAKQYSEHDKSASEGGDLGVRAPSMSPAAASGDVPKIATRLERESLKLDVGEVSDPFRFSDSIVVMTMVFRQPTRFKSVRENEREITEAVRGEKLQKIKAKWLADLRKRTHVDIRL